MIFDVHTQNWTVHANEISFIWNCCSGSIVTLRGFHLFFHQLAYIIGPDDDSSPIISRILGNGTVVDLEIIKPPFEKEFEHLMLKIILMTMMVIQEWRNLMQLRPVLGQYNASPRLCRSSM